MLQSFFVYGFQIISISILGIILNNKSSEYKKGFWNWETLLIFIIFTFFAAVRYDVGVDYISYLSIYIKGYSEHNTYVNELEPLFANYINIPSFYFAYPCLLLLGYIIFSEFGDIVSLESADTYFC